MRISVLSFLSLLLCTSSACTKAETGSQCPSGSVELDGVCHDLCSVDCDKAGECCAQGVCLPCEGEAPVILGVDGDGSVDDVADHAAHHIAKRLRISGEHLADATAVLVDSQGQSHVLESCGESTDTVLEAALPVDLAEDTYVLSVANQGGGCSVEVNILQGEPGELGTGVITSDMLLDGDVGADDIDSAQVQRRVVAACPVGQSIRSVGEDGSVVCEGPQVGAGVLARSDGTHLIDSGVYDDGQGHVGVGTQSPNAALSVSGTLSRALSGTVTVAMGDSEVFGASTAFTSEIRVGDAIMIFGEVFTVAQIDSDTSLFLDAAHGAGAGAVTAYADGLLQSVQSASGVPALTVDSSGRVALGHQSPGATLDVAGDVRVSGSHTGAIKDVAWHAAIPAGWCGSPKEFHDFQCGTDAKCMPMIRMYAGGPSWVSCSDSAGPDCNPCDAGAPNRAIEGHIALSDVASGTSDPHNWAVFFGETPNRGSSYRNIGVINNSADSVWFTCMCVYR